MTKHAHTNRLINETSPYLLQHAHNPVDWYPWGNEAFEAARREQKPILLSIGYSACHWCHVMEHESFESESIAALMNENFVNIKVDREERPDLDQIYMNAVQMMTQHGGWPMTVFLTPDALPFYAGTYFPPEDRHNMPGFPRVLTALAAAYRERPDEIKETAASVLAGLQRTAGASESEEQLSPELLDIAYRGIVRNYDASHGGFGGAPKFPPAMSLEFLLHYHHRTGEQRALEIVEYTARKMAEGGIYDHLGGGFHRYSTDARWLVPHFEKMLYDNALLSRLYLHCYQVTRNKNYRAVVEGILDYVSREMTDPKGGFYSTQDADSEGVEGKFFVWSFDEIKQVLGDTDARVFADYYNVSEEGNFEDHNILNVTRDIETVAKNHNLPVEQLSTLLESCRQKLFEQREQRVKPGRDEKILTAWNGLMLTSFAEAAAILGRDDYADIATRNAEFLLSNMRRDGLLLRTYKDSQAKLNAYLEDYSFLAQALLSLYEATGEFRWFEEALRLTNKLVEEFWDDAAGGFFFTGGSHESLIVRSKDFFDNATPSGNSVAAEVLLRLAVLTNDEDYRRRAITIFRLTHEFLRRYPAGFGQLLSALDFYFGPQQEIAILGNRGASDTQVLLDEIWRNYLPNKVVAHAQPGVEPLQTLPLLEGRTAIDGKATAYVCENYVCQQPVTEAAALREQLSQRKRVTA